jgi:membrane-bound lytic murein transglycosylase B
MRYILLALLITFTLNAKDYRDKLSTKYFIKKMVDKHKFNRDELNRLFSSVKFQKQALARYVRHYRPVKKPTKKPKKHKKPRSGSWDRYEGWLLKQSRVDRGVRYMREHKKSLDRAYQEFGVPPEYITAIIGIESYYGKNRGKYPVFDTLTTLAFEPNRRNKFFRHQLQEFLLMTRVEEINPKNVMGSIAGAIGLGQFMPSNYEKLAIDFNGDGKKQMNNHIDAIGSIAHYFKENPNKLAQKDCDAKWTKKNGQSEYGYKDHIASDQKTKIITKYEVTSASTHDSQVIKDLIDKDDKVIYADSAYKSQEIEEDLKDKNIQSKIIKRAYRNKPLTNQENKENYKHSKTRVRVEHIFGTLTSQFNNALNLTVIGIDRIKSAIGLINLTYNLVRYEQLVRLNKVQIV